MENVMPLSDPLVLGTVVFTILSLVLYRILNRRRDQLYLGGSKPGVLAHPASIDVKTVMMIVVSTLVLGSSLYVILSQKYQGESEKWAYGVIGTILGFWLRPEK
jgi:hypothetical protein